MDRFGEKHGPYTIVYHVAALGKYDPKVILETWTLQQLHAMYDALMIEHRTKQELVSTYINSIFGGKK